MSTPLIVPGFLTASGSSALRAAVVQVERTRQDLERWVDDEIDEFPARLTGVSEDFSPARWSWTEQTYDSAGQRYTKPNGRTGGPDYMPAFAAGNGVIPPPGGFPLDVFLRRRIVATDDNGSGSGVGVLGPVYEFDWNCACDCGSGSGSGDSSGGTVPTPPGNCCPQEIPDTLTVTLTQTGGVACACGDGQSFAMSYQGHYALTDTPGVGHNWKTATGLTVCDQPFTLYLSCMDAGSWRVRLYWPCHSASPANIGASSSCSPLQWTTSGLLLGGSCFGCSDVFDPPIFTITITE